MINAFREEGLNLHAIPLINEVEQGILAEDLDPGTVIGCRTPISEKDEAGVLVWDGDGISAVSFMVFHRNQTAGWIFNNNHSEVGGEIDPNIRKQKNKKKSKKTTPTHKEQKQRKERNGRRV